MYQEIQCHVLYIVTCTCIKDTDSTQKSKYINKSFHLLPVLRRGMFFWFTIKDKQTLHMHGCYGAKWSNKAYNDYIWQSLPKPYSSPCLIRTYTCTVQYTQIVHVVIICVAILLWNQHRKCWSTIPPISTKKVVINNSTNINIESGNQQFHQYQQKVVINNSTNINRESSDQEFHQYQQRKWWSTIPPISA
jgi:hypothetical protein